MAKVAGPLYSAEARGRIADIMVHFPWKGRACVRQWLKPTNPKSVSQIEVRSHVKFLSQGGMYFANRTVEKKGASTDKILIKAVTPSAQIWNAYLMEMCIGDLRGNWEAAETAWSAMTATAQDAWDTAAAGLTPVIAGGTFGTHVITAGENFYHYRYGLYKMGIDTAPTETPPAYS